MKHKKPEVLKIFVWDDAFGCPAGWQFKEDIEKGVSRVYSVGFLIQETKNTLTIAPHIGGTNRENQQYSGVLTIPKRQIVAIFSFSLSYLLPELKQTLQHA